MTVNADVEAEAQEATQELRYEPAGRGFVSA
jgi:hypothetical protein